MKRKNLIVINIAVLVIIMISLYSVINKTPVQTNQEQDCLDLNHIRSLIYNVCYDAYTKKIYINLERKQDIYTIEKININFFDFSQNNIPLSDVPKINETKKFKINSEKNPENIFITLDLMQEFSAPICKEPRKIKVDYCNFNSEDEEVSADINQDQKDDYIQIGKQPIPTESDKLAENLIDREKQWKTLCTSQWRCSSWEPCENGVQKRTCIDTNKCSVSTDVPITTKYCNGTCKENWECSWSACKNGFTVPTCKDLNKCGTELNKPTKLSCSEPKTTLCNSDIQCSSWTPCSAEYNFIDLVDGVENIQGEKTRSCYDKNGCVETKIEEKNCSISEDIYTKKFNKCGKEYIGIYNRLTNKMMARLEKSDDILNPYINIDLSEGDWQNNPYCDYCFNGKKDGDETEIDCGGSCPNCEDIKIIKTKDTAGFLDRLRSFLNSLMR